MRGIVANLQAALNFSQECLRLYAEKYEEATGSKFPDLTDDEKRKIARKAHMLNGSALELIYCPWAPSTVLGWHSQLITQKYNSTGPNQKRRGRPRDASSGEKSFFQHSIGDVPVNGAGFLEKHSVVTD